MSSRNAQKSSVVLMIVKRKGSSGGERYGPMLWETPEVTASLRGYFHRNGFLAVQTCL